MACSFENYDGAYTIYVDYCCCSNRISRKRDLLLSEWHCISVVRGRLASSSTSYASQHNKLSHRQAQQYCATQGYVFPQIFRIFPYTFRTFP
jgi:hypothetical protein